MASLYPTLEDMVIDQYQSAQLEKGGNTFYDGNNATSFMSQTSELPKSPSAPIYESGTICCCNAYPLLPPYFSTQVTEPQNTVSTTIVPKKTSTNAISGSQVVVGTTVMMAPLTFSSTGLQKANVTHGIRQVILIRNKKKEKYGLRFRSLNKGIFVHFVSKDSPAAAAGIRFGDQILKVNDKEVVGMEGDKVLDLMTKPKDAQEVTLTIRDRPFERTITLHKDSVGMFGFGHKDNLITAITKDSSASRNGLLTDHRILEVDGRSIIGFSVSIIYKLPKQKILGH
ncbi:unnamed protein product [Enterobius vermicularis]|uniref:PDZ domain-containing protein n=1 Tax=Enterobius vermicularis TaxID=51028 RepID=A0A0N4V0K6_ENTVE|nr:unnamed protein product [Enterobius vermicularis]